MNGGDEQNRQFNREHEHQTDLGPDERRNDERYSVRGPCAYELIEGEGEGGRRRPLWDGLFIERQRGRNSSYARSPTSGSAIAGGP